MFILSLRVNKSPSEYSQQKGGDGRTPDPYLEPLEAGRLMHRFGRRFIFLLEELITDAYVLFGKDEYLTGQAVTGGGHFNGVFRYPIYIDRCLPAAPAKACAHRNQVQHIRRKSRFRHAGRNGLLQESEPASAREAVFLAVLVPHQWLRTSAARHG